jgi:hypothetical protein
MVWICPSHQVGHQRRVPAGADVPQADEHPRVLLDGELVAGDGRGQSDVHVGGGQLVGQQVVRVVDPEAAVGEDRCVGRGESHRNGDCRHVCSPTKKAARIDLARCEASPGRLWSVPELSI